jgi:hypothetical protein
MARSSKVGRAESAVTTKRCWSSGVFGQWRQYMFFVHYPLSSTVSDRPMTDDSDKREGHGEPRAKDSRQDSRQERLKLALRDNLKRRKSQARQRGKMTDAPSNNHENALDDDSESERGG